MTKWKSHNDQKGFLGMSKKWGNKGTPKSTIREGAKKFEVPYKRTKIKA